MAGGGELIGETMDDLVERLAPHIRLLEEAAVRRRHLNDLVLARAILESIPHPPGRLRLLHGDVITGALDVHQPHIIQHVEPLCPFAEQVALLIGRARHPEVHHPLEGDPLDLPDVESRVDVLSHRQHDQERLDECEHQTGQRTRVGLAEHVRECPTRLLECVIVRRGVTGDERDVRLGNPAVARLQQQDQFGSELAAHRSAEDDERVELLGLASDLSGGSLDDRVGEKAPVAVAHEHGLVGVVHEWLLDLRHAPATLVESAGVVEEGQPRVRTTTVLEVGRIALMRQFTQQPAADGPVECDDHHDERDDLNPVEHVAPCDRSESG